jgi:hypothetical protein
MKVDDLTGIELDYWVAKSQGLNVKNYSGVLYSSENSKLSSMFILTVDWSFVGEIIEDLNYDIRIYNIKDPNVKKLVEVVDSETLEIVYSKYDKTALEAVKRCIVKLEYGEEVTE